MDSVSRPSLAEQGKSVPAPTSFEQFFRAEHLRLFRALFLLSGSAAEAEDLMQDAFVKVWERWDRVRSMDDPVGYLYRTAMNVFRSARRRLVRAAKRPFGRDALADDLAVVEDRDAAARALRSLSPRQRAALVLTEYVGYSSEEAAGVMRVKASTVRALAHQGRAALRGTTDE